ncbi:MAG TPA: tetratricopeptide repeat protein [Candidatus Kapabacteria bacterium]|nr:tetratricopeptide repeat protein [Candidatus Kapabacteria bacterium]
MGESAPLDRDADTSFDSYLDHERRAHTSFAQSRRDIYVEQTDAIAALDRFAEARGDGRGVVVTGESGSGKSALLANWTERFRSRHPGAFIIEHFVGAVASSASHVDLIRHVIAEIKVRSASTDPLPISSEELEETLPLWLAKVQGEDLLLVIDAVNEIEEAGEIGRWLPEYLPTHIRIVVSTLEDGVFETLRARGWSVCVIAPLSSRERAAIVGEYLAQHEVVLSPEYRERVVSAGPTANPLFLRTSLDELRVAPGASGSPDIDHYLSASGLPELMRRVLQRIEDEHGRDVVEVVLGLLWVSRNGLAVSEVAAIASVDGGIVRSLLASLALHLIEREGKLAFFHEQFRDAVRRQYVIGQDRDSELRERVAEYVQSHASPSRIAEELPWQLSRLQQWERLAETFTDPDVFEQIHLSGDHVQLYAYWSELRARSEIAEMLLQRVLASVDAPGDRDRSATLCDRAGAFLSDVGELDRASVLIERSLAIRRERLAPTHSDVVASTIHLARLLTKRGSHSEAERILRDVLATLEAVASPDRALLVETLESLGTLLVEQREFASALPICSRALEIAETMPATRRTISRYLSLAGAAHLGLDDYESAAPLIERAVTLSQQRLGSDHPLTIECVNNLGTVLFARGEHARAQECFEAAIASWERVLGPRFPPIAIALANLGVSYGRTHRTEEAVAVLARAVELGRDTLGEAHPSTATQLCNLAMAYRAVGDYALAESVQRRALAIFLEAYGEDHRETIQTKLDLAVSRFHIGDVDGAIEGYRAQLPRKAQLLGLGHPSTQSSLARYREILSAAGVDERSDPLAYLWSEAREA